MTTPSLVHLLPGPFNFLVPEPEEVRQLVPDADHTLPVPQRIYFEDEAKTPIYGFPLLLSPGFRELREALTEYLAVEERAHVAVFMRQPFDRKLYAAAWQKYVRLLSQAIENVTISSYGRHFPSIFWLAHSKDTARLLKETPKRVRRLDLAVGRSHGDLIKYRVFDRFLDRVLSTTYDLVNRVAVDTEEVEEELFPRLLTEMRDNVLIFTEDHISHSLEELGSYFSAYLQIDGREFRRRLDHLISWHQKRQKSDAGLRQVILHLHKVDPDTHPRELLNRPGYLSYLTTRSEYDPDLLLPPQLVEVWEQLLIKLKQFELFHSLRRFLVPLQREDNALVLRADSTSRALAGPLVQVVSSTTRPLDFMAPWVVEPVVDRYGLIYDITDFSEIVAMLGRASTDLQDRSFRQMFRFQRRVNRMATAHRMKLEKYLGDGAFYSSRYPVELLMGAVRLQRYYRQVVEDGFPFDRGMRMALNHGHYRLIPFGRRGEDERYEFFGHGLIELSRLVTGKAVREIEEIKNFLINLGYPVQTVHRFFAPLTQRNMDVVNKSEESRPFYAYINENGNLINEGIVATAPFISQLDRATDLPRLYRVRDRDRSYVALPLESEGEPLVVGIRRLGLANLKGLDKIAVYEIVDGSGWSQDAFEEIGEEDGVFPTIEREFASTYGHPTTR